MLELKETRYPGYFVSDSGVIYSIKSGFLKEYKFKKNPDGYLNGKFSINGRLFYTSSHRLVAESWISNPFNLPQVNHKDGDKLNNHVSNLEWVTLKENNRHAVQVLGKRRGQNHKLAKLTDQQAMEIKKDPRTLAEIAKEYSCGISTVHRIKKGLSWHHLKQS